MKIALLSVRLEYSTRVNDDSGLTTHGSPIRPVRHNPFSSTKLIIFARPFDDLDRGENIMVIFQSHFGRVQILWSGINYLLVHSVLLLYSFIIS